MARRRFAQDERGLALSEYLILLGLLTGGVVLSVNMFFGSIGTVWGDWAEFMARLRVTQQEAMVENPYTPAAPAAPKTRKTTPCQNGIDNGNAENSNCGGNP